MLYIFAGPPRCGLNASGLWYCIEECERLGELEHDPTICYTKEGVFVVPRGSQEGERLGSTEHVLSAALEREGITWDWFYPTWGFGNMVGLHKTTAVRETMWVDHRSGQRISDLLATAHPIDMSKLIIQRVPKLTEGWEKYERRWKPGTCPQETHQVIITCVMTRGRLDGLAYSRLERLIEDPSAVLDTPERYREFHFSPTRKWNGGPAMPGPLALPSGWGQVA